MSNRYAPPLADLGDPETPKWSPPGGVALAIRLLWISLALGVPSFLYEFGRSPAGLAFAISVAVQLAPFALAAWVILNIHRARNWARIVSLALTVLEAGILLFGLTPAEEAVIEVVCNWVAAGLDVAAMVLLFRRSASAWFRRQERHR